MSRFLCWLLGHRWSEVHYVWAYSARRCNRCSLVEAVMPTTFVGPITLDLEIEL